MTLKEKITTDFLKNDSRNYALYRLSLEKISAMYDKVVAAIKQGETMERFMNFENATTGNGRIRFDMETSYENEKKKIIKTKVVFKYPVYKFLWEAYKTAMAEIKEKENNIPLSGPIY